LNDKRIINSRSVPSSNTQVGFAFNRTTNTIYVKKVSEKAILKYDEYLIKTLNTTKFEEAGFWKRISTDYTYFAEVIVINPMTNKVYVSDSKSKLLYEMDG
jgi:DNA-binding beta-propeller fold protein YncE